MTIRLVDDITGKALTGSVNYFNMEGALISSHNIIPQGTELAAQALQQADTLEFVSTGHHSAWFRVSDLGTDPVVNIIMTPKPSFVMPVLIAVASALAIGFLTKRKII